MFLGRGFCRPLNHASKEHIAGKLPAVKGGQHLALEETIVLKDALHRSRLHQGKCAGGHLKPPIAIQILYVCLSKIVTDFSSAVFMLSKSGWSCKHPVYLEHFQARSEGSKSNSAKNIDIAHNSFQMFEVVFSLCCLCVF